MEWVGLGNVIDFCGYHFLADLDKKSEYLWLRIDQRWQGIYQGLLIFTLDEDAGCVYQGFFVVS